MHTFFSSVQIHVYIHSNINTIFLLKIVVYVKENCITFHFNLIFQLFYDLIISIKYVFYIYIVLWKILFNFFMKWFFKKISFPMQ